VFYDNNLLANSHVEELLERLSSLRLNGRRAVCESQSGFDGRIMRQRPELARLIKEANFKVPRIAWDGPYSDVEDIRRQLEILVDAGYSSREVFVFFLYNWDVPYEDMYRKVERLWDWQVQISDCRFRPLDQTYDYFNPRKWRVGQTGKDYHIHPGWSDQKVRALRKIVRWHNIAMRHRGYAEYVDNYLRVRAELHPARLTKESGEKVDRTLELFSDVAA